MDTTTNSYYYFKRYRKFRSCRVPWKLHWNVRDTFFRNAQTWNNYNFWVNYNSSTWKAPLGLHSASCSLCSNQIASESSIPAWVWEPWDWDWPPHALMLHLINGHGRQQQHVFHTRWWKRNSDSHADESSAAHRPFPCIVVIISAQGTFI